MICLSGESSRQETVYMIPSNKVAEESTSSSSSNTKFELYSSKDNSSKEITPQAVQSSLIQLLSDAFDDNSFTVTVFNANQEKKNNRRFEAFRKCLFEIRLNLWYQHSWSIFTSNHDKHHQHLVGHIAMQPPSKENHMSLSLWKLVKLGLPIPYHFGIGVTRRFWAIMAQIDQQQEDVKRTHGKYILEDSWTLEAFGVAQEYRGKGIGGRILREILEKWVPPSEGVWLATQTERNVAMYRKHKFRVLSWRRIELEDDGVGNGFDNWILWRPPVQDAAKDRQIMG